MWALCNVNGKGIYEMTFCVEWDLKAKVISINQAMHGGMVIIHVIHIIQG